jgi:hypothetical protein
MFETEYQENPTQGSEANDIDQQELVPPEESSSDEIEIVAISIDGMCGVY